MTSTPPSHSMTGYLPFSWDNHAIRTDHRPDGSVWFIAIDVCAALDIVNTSQAVGRLDNDEKGICTTDTLRGSQRLLAVNESGLYELVSQSRKPEAKAFRKWVTVTVLPSLRRDGAYAVGAEHMPSAEQKILYEHFRALINEALRRYDRLTEHDHWRSPARQKASAHAAMGYVSREMGLPLQVIEAVTAKGAEVGCKAFLKAPQAVAA